MIGALKWGQSWVRRFAQRFAVRHYANQPRRPEAEEEGNSPGESAETPPGRFEALRHRDFRLYWTGLFFSNIGTWMQLTAVSWLLYALTRSPLQLGANGLFRALPVIGVGILSGALVDRYDRKRLLLTTQALLAALALLLGLLDHSDTIQPWHIYGVTFLSAAVGACDGPARQALYPSLVPRRALPSAVALNSILWKAPALIGPSLAGAAISVFGTSGAFYANAGSYLFVIVALLRMRAPTAVARPVRRFRRDIKAGLDYVFSQKLIVGVLAMEATSALFGIDNAMLTIFASDLLRVGAHGFGLLQSARGMGAVIGSGLYIGIGHRPSQGKILLVAAAIYGVCFALFGLSSRFPLSLALLCLVGAADAVWAAARSTMLQWTAPEKFRGRVMGMFQTANQGINPLGQVETGLVVPLIGAREATMLGGAIVGVSTLLTIWRFPQIHRFEIKASEFPAAKDPGLSALSRGKEKNHSNAL